MSENLTDHDHVPHTTVKEYMMVFGALMGLTVLTVVISQIHLGLLGNALAAVLIAAVKTSLVVYFFMHVRESPKIILFIVVSSFAWVSILFLFTIADFRAQYGDGASSLPGAMPW